MDKQSQYSRRETIKVSNFPEHEGENLREVMINIAANCGIHINGDHISVIHRNGPRSHGRPRDFICKFTVRDIKHDLMRCKHYLRRVDGFRYVYLDEHLTPLRARIVRALRDSGYTVRTVDGKIHCSITINGEEVRSFYDTAEDFGNLPFSEEQCHNLGLYRKI